MRWMRAAGTSLALMLVCATVRPVCGQEPAAEAAPDAAGQAGAAAAAGEHPLVPAIALAKQGLASIGANITDYSCTMVKRERVNGELGGHQYMFMKVRHQPFSVYINFLAPEEVKNQEVLWVEGRNDGNMWAHAGGGVRAMVGTISLKPDSPIAMEGQRYPVTEIGVENLARKLVEVAEHDSQFGECEVNFFPGAKVNGRTCTCIQVVHPVPRRNFRFHMARVFIDDDMRIPVRFEAYDWPATAGDPPLLLEEYTYTNVKLNNGFTDADFDITNPAYKFSSAK